MSIEDLPTAPSTIGPMLAEVTNTIVRLHRERYGKGPTRSKSYLLDDVLICMMRDVFTPVEKTLIEAGRQEQVRSTRLAFQDVMADSFTSAVEEITGRRVIAFTSQVIFDPDAAVELFVLEPVER